MTLPRVGGALQRATRPRCLSITSKLSRPQHLTSWRGVLLGEMGVEGLTLCPSSWTLTLATGPRVEGLHATGVPPLPDLVVLLGEEDLGSRIHDDHERNERGGRRRGGMEWVVKSFVRIGTWVVLLLSRFISSFIHSLFSFPIRVYGEGRKPISQCSQAVEALSFFLSSPTET